MTMEILTCPQGSPEWFQARLGIPTASEYHTVMASGVKKGEPSKTRQLYLDKLAGERITGKPMENYSNDYMQRGKDQEQQARDLYSFMYSADVIAVGFIKRTDLNTGCSPDALIGDHGLLEIKTKAAHLMVKAIRDGKENPPPEHMHQCQGGLWVTQRSWVDLNLHCEGFNPIVYRIFRNEEYIGRVAEAVGAFNRDLAALVAQVKAAQ